MGRDQNISFNRDLKKIILTLMDDFEMFKTSLEADVKETVRKLELEVKLEYVTELLQPYDKMLMDEELFLIDEQRKFSILLLSALPCRIWDLSSITRYRTCTPHNGSRVLTTGWPGKSQKVVS